MDYEELLESYNKLKIAYEKLDRVSYLNDYYACDRCKTGIGSAQHDEYTHCCFCEEMMCARCVKTQLIIPKDNSDEYCNICLIDIINESITLPKDIVMTIIMPFVIYAKNNCEDDEDIKYEYDSESEYGE